MLTFYVDLIGPRKFAGNFDQLMKQRNIFALVYVYIVSLSARMRVFNTSTFLWVGTLVKGTIGWRTLE